MTLAVILALLLFIGWREWRWDKERADLLQRIQAPEVAIQQHAQRPKRPPVAPVPVNDDDAFRAAKERRLSGNAD